MMTEPNATKEDSIQQQIIQAAQQLFQVHGLQKVTMDDVAREIGKRRSSLYYYYKNKEEILDAAIDVEMRCILAELTQAVDAAPNLEEKISAYCMSRLKRSQKTREFYTMVDSGMNAGEMSDYTKVIHTMHTRFRQLEIPLLRKILNFGIETGRLRAMDLKEQDALIFVLLSSIQGFKKEIIVKKSFNNIKPAVSMWIYLILQGFKK
ncbi:MAG: transcriptional regulator, TetR family [Mucilaginibacter sp.]|nr:transcriptional regulator, TetR family [Mucilaginibacter sp.]MDB5018422.1 transcriptional regulator, TetR family [Mucilaginibacter sp.]